MLNNSMRDYDRTQTNCFLKRRRVRKKVGGVLYWGSVENARKSIFKIQDSEVSFNSLVQPSLQSLLFAYGVGNDSSSLITCILSEDCNI